MLASIPALSREGQLAFDEYRLCAPIAVVGSAMPPALQLVVRAQHLRRSTKEVPPSNEEVLSSPANNQLDADRDYLRIVDEG